MVRRETLQSNPDAANRRIPPKGRFQILCFRLKSTTRLDEREKSGSETLKGFKSRSPEAGGSPNRRKLQSSSSNLSSPTNPVKTNP